MIWEGQLTKDKEGQLIKDNQTSWKIIALPVLFSDVFMSVMLM